MASLNWVGAAGDWEDPANWSTNTVPTSADDVIIAQGHPTLASAPGAANTIVVSGTGNLTVDGATLSTNSFAIPNTATLSVTDLATLNIAGAAGFGTAGTLTGQVFLSGGSQIEFGSGSITSIADGSALHISDPDSFLSNASDTSSSSALAGLSENHGTLQLDNGASLELSGSCDNSGEIDVDNGSTFSVAGTLTNSNILKVDLGAVATIDAIDNTGSINIQGESATLAVQSAAGFGTAGELTGTVDIAGEALLQFASGQITDIAAGATLSISGAQAYLADATDTNSNSALTGLSHNAGTLQLDGGAVVALSGNYSNDGNTAIDGGSAMTVAGNFTNAVDLEIDGGSVGVSQTFTNTGTVEIDGGGSLVLNADLDGTGTFQLSDGSTLTVGGTVETGETVQIVQGVLNIGSPADFHGTIGGFDAADTLDLTNVGFNAGDSVQLLSGNVLQVSESDGTTYTLQLSQSDDFTGDTFGLRSDGAAGTQIVERETGANNPPTTTPVTLASIAEDSGARVITQAELLANAHDIDGDSLTVANLQIASGVGTLLDNHDGTWTYTPASNDDTGVSFSYEIDDGFGGTAAGSASLDITPVNDAPVNTVPGTQVTDEDTAKVFSSGTGNQISVSDVDNTSHTVTLTATDGAITLNGVTGLTFTNGDGTADASMTFSGTDADINAALNGLSFAPTANFNGTASIEIATNDGSATDTDTVSITVNAVNDSPVNTVPGTQVTNEDTAKVFSSGTGNQISVSDVDNTSHTVTLTATDGAITLNGIAGLTFTDGDGTADTSMSFSGTDAAINTALNGLSFAPTANFSGTASIEIATSDGSATDTDTVNITVNAVNDAPINTVPGTQVADEDTAKVFSSGTGNQISVSDVDNTSHTVTLTATDGTITLNGSTGLAFTSGDGSADASMSFSGTDADINAALNGLSFAPTANFNGTASIEIATSDGSASDTDTVSINVNAVNDAPTTTPVTLTPIAENSGPRLITQAKLLANAQDVDGDALTATNLVIATGLGTLVDNHNGTWTYTPAPNDDTGVSFSYDVDDGHGGTAAGSATLDITPAIPGVTINGTNRNDTVDDTHTVKGQPLPTGDDDVINGKGGNDHLSGLAGNDTLNGGTGADKMFGGLGDDTYMVDNNSDVVNETGGDGTDTVLSSISFSLANATHAIGEIEDLTLTGHAAIKGTGNALDNVITGNSGANVLSGGIGADILDGGLGSDTASYAGSGAAVTVSLALGTASGGDATGDTLLNIENLTGSKFGDILEGNAGNNKLAGGAGSDTVSYADATAGVTVSLALTKAQNTVGAGKDTLSAFENLTGSAFNDKLTGNTGANVLTGLDGNDTLNGGKGADHMFGGLGDDTYTVDNKGDVVDETGGSGTDTVRAAISFDLSDATHVIGGIENLILTGTAALHGTGNDLANTIAGNVGANVLNGGAGDDTLTGGAGSDTFVFHASFGKDTITDFMAGSKAGHDIVDLDQTSFANFAALTASGAMQQVGTDTVITIDANDTITLHNVTLGKLVAADFHFV